METASKVELNSITSKQLQCEDTSGSKTHQTAVNVVFRQLEEGHNFLVLMLIL